MITFREALEVTGTESGRVSDLHKKVMPRSFSGLAITKSLATILDRATWLTEPPIDVVLEIRPPETPLGGWCRFIVRGNGDWSFEQYIENIRGLPSYDFSGIGILQAPGSRMAITCQISDHVGGQIDGGQLSSYRKDEGNSISLRENWNFFRGATLSHRMNIDEGGSVAFLEDVAVAVLAYYAGFVTGGATFAGYLVVGGELAERAPVTVFPPTLAGLAGAAAVVLIGGPQHLLLAVAIGGTVGSYRAEKLSHQARDLARSVFGDTLDFDRIYITNLVNPLEPSRAKCVMAGSDIWIYLGENFFDPLANLRTRTTLIHELVHAWQIIHETFSPGVMSDFIFNVMHEAVGICPDPYAFAQDGSIPWNELNIEGQASAVATWYNVFNEDLNSVIAASNPLFPYVRDHIRTGTG